MSFAQNARTSISARHHTRELSGDLRAGAWSRRQLRTLQRSWLRKHWRIVGWVAVGVVLACGAIETLAPATVRGYLVGALIASAAWWIYWLMITSGGLAGKIIGIAAETSTATELRLLCRRGWHLVNHVLVEYGDVDHVLLGPGGFFAIETKFKSNWEHLDRETAKFAIKAKEGADDAWLRMGPPRTKIRTLVVLCGGGIDELCPEPFDVEGVTFCTGAGLRDYLRTLPDGVVSEGELVTAFAKLQDNLVRSDRREAETQGGIPRPGIDGLQDVVVTSLSAAGALLVVALSMTLFASILWAVPTAAVVIAAATWFRRTLPTNARVQRATTAVVTSAAFLGTLSLVAWTIDLLRR